MHIGISPWGSSRGGMVAVAAAAVEAGVDTLWLGDGLLVVPDFPPWSGGMESFSELAWLAGRYPTAGIGITAAVLPLRDVMWVAKQAASLDHLTEGRFTLVVTPGIWEREFAYRGLEFESRGRRFEESIKALRAAFRGEPYDGEYVSLPEEGRLSPIPLTDGGPPIWLAGERATMERALALELPFQARARTPDQLAPLAREWFDRGGHELTVRIGLEIAASVPTGDDASSSVAEVNRVVGPPGHLLDALRAYESLGVSDVSLMPGRDDTTSLVTIEALGSEILPALRAGR